MLLDTLTSDRAAILLPSFAFTLCSVALAFYLRLSNSFVKNLPRAGKAPGWFNGGSVKRDFIENGSKIIEEGYRKYRDSMFLVQTADMERIVLSPKYVDEIRTAPESVLSVRQGMAQRHLGNFTTLDIILTSHLQNDVCKTHLTQNLHQLVGPVNEEAQYWLGQLLDKPSVELPGHQTILRIIAGVTSRVLIGLPTSRDEDWLDVAVGYTGDVFQVSTALRPYPPFLRYLVAPFLSSTKRMRSHIQVANKKIGHLFAEKLNGSEKEDVNMIQWMTEAAQGGDRDVDVLVKKLLFLTLAAVHTSTMSATHALFDLCAMPEYIEPLREEAQRVIGERGWTLAGINELKLLDSFMKESQRINHPGLLSFNRRVMQPLHLSDGVTIPAKTFITMATNSIARDPQNYSDPDTFDGFRFYKRRQQSAQDATRHQFVSTGPDSLPFGHGKFACPGRFFAAAQIKVVLANILLGYDVSFPDGQTARPENIFSGEGIGPDRTQRIVFKRRAN
ncbi:cytochrome P450 [Xylariaceae sp. FL0594]|nr:cytochrome P450 [Xylariaceae sp. FL0594]